MTSFTIPVILAATIAIGAIFAFMPVDQVSTVHTTILLNTVELQAVAGLALDIDSLDEIRVDCTTPFTIIGLFIEEDTNVDGGDDIEIEEIELEGAAAGGNDITYVEAGMTNTSTTAAQLDADGFDYFNELTDEEFMGRQIVSNGAPVDFAMVTVGTEDDETYDVTAMVLAPSGAGCTTIARDGTD